MILCCSETITGFPFLQIKVQLWILWFDIIIHLDFEISPCITFSYDLYLTQTWIFCIYFIICLLKTFFLECFPFSIPDRIFIFKICLKSHLPSKAFFLILPMSSSILLPTNTLYLRCLFLGYYIIIYPVYNYRFLMPLFIIWVHKEQCLNLSSEILCTW